MEFRAAVLALALALALLVPSIAHAQDTVVVRAENPPAWGLRPRLVEEVRIGTLDGDERYAFGRIGDLAVGDDGVIWVCDPQAKAIRRFSPEGEALGSVGREGEGPGEFGDPGNVERLADGRMVTWDQRLFRVSFFGADGTFERSFQLNTGVVIGAPGVFTAGHDGVLYVMTLDRALGAPNPLLAWLRVTLDGEVLDSLPGLPNAVEGPRAYPVRNVRMMSPRGYVVRGRTDRWALTHPLPDGRVLRVERRHEPVPFARAERAEAERREAFQAVEMRGEKAQPIPREKPAFRDLQVDEEGRVWVRLHGEAVRVPQTPGEEALNERARAFFGREGPPPQEWREPPVYDVVEDGGRYLGRVALPHWDSRVAAARDRRMWVIETGAYGEEYVVRYRVEAGS